MSIKLSDLTEVSELKDHIGEEVSLGGWCYNSRISKKCKVRCTSRWNWICAMCFHKFSIK